MPGACVPVTPASRRRGACGGNALRPRGRGRSRTHRIVL